MRLSLSAAALLGLVLLAGLTSARLLSRDHRATLAARAEHDAELLRTSHARDVAATQMLLQRMCAHDVEVERLALTLAAGAIDEADAARSALSLSRSLGAEVWLLRARGPALSLIGTSGAPPSHLPSLSALRAAVTAPRIFGGEPARVLDTCERPFGRERLWIVRTSAVSALTERARAGVQLVPEAARAEADAEDRVDALALTIDGVDDAPTFRAYVRAEGAPPGAALFSFAPLLAVLLLFGALLAYVGASKQQLDDSVLVELERAATRVAEGDLTARIGRRLGGRADQTFQTFDRMTAELKEMRDRLADAERVAAWQDIARRIAHEIKNPLSPIQIAIETLRKAHEKRLASFDEIFDESTRAILEEVRRMERIVREFSEFARLPRAKPGALELSALVEETVALYRPEDVRVTVDASPATIPLHADREQLTQVLINLLQNALDAARAAASPTVNVQLEVDDHAVFVHVDDNGAGVAEADRARVFEPYYTTKDHGTGLGLAIVKRIAFDHGGSVAVSTSPLGGARFTLRLPH